MNKNPIKFFNDMAYKLKRMSKLSALSIMLLLNLGVIYGLYVYFQHQVDVKFSSLSLKQPKEANSNEVLVKNIPMLATQVELIRQDLPKLNPPDSAVTHTVSPTILPTLLEKPLAANKGLLSASIVKPAIQQIPSVHQANKSPLTKNTHHSIQTQQPPIEKMTNTLPTENVLTSRDLPTQLNATQTSSKTVQITKTQELESRTVALSEAINQVKRLNQKAIDNRNDLVSKP